MSASTDLVVLFVLSLLTIIAGVHHWKAANATSSRLRSAPTEKPTDDNGDDDPNKNRSFGGEQPTLSGDTSETNANVSGLGCCSYCSVDWTPVPFTYPPVTPVTEALDQIPPRPYRPYKPGRHQ
jgi:hypothetical protein